MLSNKAPFCNTLLPNNYKNVEDVFEINYKYQYLNKICDEHYNDKVVTCEWKENGSHHANFKSLNQDQLSYLDEVLSRNPKLKFDDEVLSLLENVLTEEVDEALKAYLGTNYAVMFYSARHLTAESQLNNPSLNWHCDAAPLKSAMVMCYLNAEEQHGSSTLFLKESTTKSLKEIGYVYCDKNDRIKDLDPLLDYYQLDNTVYRHVYEAGDTVVFGAAKVAHCAQAPKQGYTRSTLDLCIIPSPVPWKEAIKNGYIPANNGTSYHGQVERLLAANELHIDAVFDEATAGNVIEIPANGGITSKESLKFHLDSIFSDRSFSQKLYGQLMGLTVNFNSLTIDELLVFIKKSFKDGLDWTRGFKAQDTLNFSELINYEKSFQKAMIRFSFSNKPNPDAVMWPIPDHPKHPRSKYDMLPYVIGDKIMDKTTPIGSAGSCFAVEIAEVLQKENFNYVITELGDNPNEEALIDGYELGSGKAMYSANFGILFNTPSLRQIAEKAFSEREFNQYFLQIENGLYMDPYRENVYFKSKENYLRDYPKHVEAIKQVLLQSEVFIFTAGLNECWQLNDGTVLSRNPRGGFYHLIEHRVLTVEENINNMWTFFNTVKRHNPKFKLILTLSPVPLLATGRGETHHILEANTHSKAVLRVAIEEVVKMHKDIYYLPSYELVTECMPNPWKADHRHVTPETVSKVISMFKEMYVKDEGS